MNSKTREALRSLVPCLAFLGMVWTSAEYLGWVKMLPWWQRVPLTAAGMAAILSVYWFVSEVMKPRAERTRLRWIIRPSLIVAGIFSLPFLLPAKWTAIVLGSAFGLIVISVLVYGWRTGCFRDEHPSPEA